jgi:uncharacterized protein
MENNNFNITRERIETVSAARTFISNVFSWMGVALAISGLVAYLFGTNPAYIDLLRTVTGGPTTLGYIVMFAPFAFVLIMSLAINKLSSTILLGLFLVFSFLMGMSLSSIFLMYTQASIALTFGVSAGMFGFMAIVGYTTKTDLTKFGSLMIMGLFGIIIASIVNFFMQSNTMGYIISIIGVLVFTGLTAYDVQKIKRIGEGAENGSEATSKLAIMGALTLYLDFINLFLFLLRFLGNRK